MAPDPAARDLRRMRRYLTTARLRVHGGPGEELVRRVGLPQERRERKRRVNRVCLLVLGGSPCSPPFLHTREPLRRLGAELVNGWRLRHCGATPSAPLMPSGAT